MTRDVVDVVIVGAGPAGLSAALWLGRCGRSTVVFDSGEPRNLASRGLHGYLTRDGMAPLALRAAGRREIRAYPTITFRDEAVRTVRRTSAGFRVQTARRRVDSRLLLLATGRTDSVPSIPGFRRFYGRGVYHCPYCDGWEHRAETIMVLEPKGALSGLAELLRAWTSNVVVCTHGAKPSAGLLRLGFKVIKDRITKLRAGRGGKLAVVRFANGSEERCGALFFCSDCVQKSRLPHRLGCNFTPDGSVRCRQHAASGVPGLFVAGNVRGGVHLAIVAAAEGAEAALAMNEHLLELERRTARRSGST
jgi:thioredoxin reductase